MHESPRIEEHSGRQFYHYSQNGLALTITDQGKIVAITFYPDNKYGYRQYKGSLPDGLLWIDTRVDVERKVGKADKNQENEAMYYRKELYIVYVSDEPHSLMRQIALDSAFRSYDPSKRRPADSADAASATVTSQEDFIPVASFERSDFEEEYKSNRPAFLRKYGNKIIRLRTLVRTFAGDGVLWMGDLEQILCYFPPSEVVKLDRLHQWDTTTVIGRLTPEGDRATLTSCRIDDRR